MLNNNMKILFLTNYASPYRVDFFNELGKSCKVTVLFTDSIKEQKHRSQNWFANQQYSNFKYIQLGKKLGCSKKYIYLDIFKFLNRNYDRIIICGYSTLTAMLAIEYMRLRKIPFYLEVDGGLIRQDTKIKFWFKKHLISAANAWFSSGKKTTEYLIHYGAKPEKIYEYPFTSLCQKDILKQKSSPEYKHILRKELNIKEDKILISIGQFVHRKGYDILLKAAADLPKDIGIYIIGDNPKQEYLLLQQKLSLKNIHFVGFQSKEELKKWYQAADVFVLPTREDIWGLVINEAMAQGLPVITTDRCVAGLELVKEGENGYIIPIENSKVLAETITKTFTKDYEGMGKKSLKFIQSYTIENMARKHIEVFNEKK